MFVSMEMEEMTNPIQHARGEKCILVIKPGSENRGIVILYYVGKVAQHKSIFSIYKEL